MCADAVSSPGASAGLQSLSGTRGPLFNRTRSLTPLGSSPSVTGATPIPVAAAEQTEPKRCDSEHAAELLVGYGFKCLLSCRLLNHRNAAANAERLTASVTVLHGQCYKHMAGVGS